VGPCRLALLSWPDHLWWSTQQLRRPALSLTHAAGLPVVIASADAAPGQQKRALGAGADDYLVRPFSIDGLLGVVDKWLSPAEPS